MKFIPSFNKFDLYFFLSNLYNSLDKLNTFSFYESNSNGHKSLSSNISKSMSHNSDSFLNYLKKQFPKKKTNLNFILKSTHNFRNEFLDNFMLHFSKFNDFSHSFELKLLKSTINNIKKNNVIVTSADKNIGTVLIESKIYHKLCLDHLSDETIYSEITENPLDKILSVFIKDLNYLHDNGHIISSLFKKLINTLNDNKSLPNFRIMPKLHKTKLGIRPLINCSKSISSILSKLLDFYFKPIVQKQYSYIKDSQDLILKNINKKFEKNSQLYSADFESLYTNIPIDDCIHIISIIVSNYSFYEVNTVAFNVLLKLLLKNSYFFYKNVDCKKFYLQIKGIFMGTAAGPSIANLSKYDRNIYLKKNLKNLF